ncbi:MAG: hypothetical protein LBQ96_02935, partial [Fusobacteriaceae bacterium]|nr:hypothetical protein [Fusobacteriaceae bacterium]
MKKIIIPKQWFMYEKAIAVFLLTLFFAMASFAVPDDALAARALVGRWGSRGVRYGFSDDGYFYRSATYTSISSIYHPSTRRYSGDYVYTTPGWWENRSSTTYFDTLFGEYRVKDGVINFHNVVSISHTVFDKDWYHEKARAKGFENLREKFEKASFSKDFQLEYEFITPQRLRLRDKGTDLDYSWELEGEPHDMPVPGHVIASVEWPRQLFPPELPVMKTTGRLRRVTQTGKDGKTPDEFKTVALEIDKTKAAPDILNYVQALRSAGWWVREPEKNSDSFNLEARKGLWLVEIKNGGESSGSSADTVTIESTKNPADKWPEYWTQGGLQAPCHVAVIGEVSAKPDENDRDIREKILFDGVSETGAAEYASSLRNAGFRFSEDAGEWSAWKYLRLNGDLYRVEVSKAENYGNITAFDYRLNHVSDGEWPVIWSKSGLPAPENFAAIAGIIDMEDWGNRDDDGDGSFSASINFLGLAPDDVKNYFSNLA